MVEIMRGDLLRDAFGRRERRIYDKIVIFEIFDIYVIKSRIAVHFALPPAADGTHRLVERRKRFARAPRLHDAPRGHDRVRRHIDGKRRGHKVPRHARIDDHRKILPVQRAQTVVDHLIDLGMRFGILVEFERRHAHAFCDLTLNGARRIYFGSEFFREDPADRGLAAAQISRERYFYLLHIVFRSFAAKSSSSAPCGRFLICFLLYQMRRASSIQFFTGKATISPRWQICLRGKLPEFCPESPPGCLILPAKPDSD